MPLSYWACHMRKPKWALCLPSAIDVSLLREITKHVAEVEPLDLSLSLSLRWSFAFPSFGAFSSLSLSSLLKSRFVSPSQCSLQSHEYVRTWWRCGFDLTIFSLFDSIVCVCVLSQGEASGSVFFVDSSSNQFLRARSSNDEVQILLLSRFCILFYLPIQLADQCKFQSFIWIHIYWSLIFSWF